MVRRANLCYFGNGFTGPQWVDLAEYTVAFDTSEHLASARCQDKLWDMSRRSAPIGNDRWAHFECTRWIGFIFLVSEAVLQSALLARVIEQVTPIRRCCGVFIAFQSSCFRDLMHDGLRTRRPTGEVNWDER